MKSIKGILIDPYSKTVTDFTLENAEDFESINKAIGSHTFTAAAVDHESDTLYVDDNGLVDGVKRPFFFLPEFSPYQSYAGKGLILGIDDNGESEDPKTQLQEITNQIEWHDRYFTKAGF